MNPESEVEVLLIEDNPADVELTLRALKKRNLANKVHVVSDGAQALEFLFQEPGQGRNRPSPKVVFLDLKLPKVDGHEVLKRMKSDPRTRTIPVVILTSSKEESDILQTYSNGANSYVVKPLDFEKFVEAVSQLGLYWVLLNEAPR
ncbi:MAG: response regulator [Acidobacteria bacterium]|jgi:CheY-like chemotaxis protein|nr:response regulator [Acidobacteriota bacterium]